MPLSLSLSPAYLAACVLPLIWECKVLTVHMEKSTTNHIILLRQIWFDTSVADGAYVHIIGTFVDGVCIVDNAQNMIILHPDHLVSATVVADAFGCIRRAVLQDRVKSTGQASKYVLFGTILHELFQEAMKANVWVPDRLEEMLMTILPRHYERLVEVGHDVNAVREDLIPKLHEMSAWSEKFVRSTPQVSASEG